MTFFKGITDDKDYYKVADEGELNERLAYIKDVINTLDKSFIVSFTGFPDFDLTTEYHSSKVYEVKDYIFSLSNIEDGQGSFYKQLEAITDLDVEWTERRNRDLLYEAYKKYTFKPEIQVIAKKRLEEVVGEIEERLIELKENKKQELLVKESLQARYAIKKVYSKRLPKGGEDGQDGFFDADIVSIKSGETVRFIHKDIFDFGVISFPKRLGGSDKIYLRELWTDEEKEISNWLSEFGVFENKIRM